MLPLSCAGPLTASSGYATISPKGVEIVTKLEQLEARLKAAQDTERALRREAAKERRKQAKEDADKRYRAEVAEALELVAYAKERQVKLDGEPITIYDLLRREIADRNRATKSGA